MQISARLSNRINAQISLQPQSRFIGVTGPSGAGKSSLFRALAGVEKTAKVQTPWTAQKVGIVFQQPMLFPHTDVRGNLALAQRHASPNAMSIDACLRGCYCEHLIDKPVQALSGGEAQRVAIARALVNGPDVLLLDESLSAIDIFTRRKIYQFLNNLCVSGQLICFAISHDLDDLALFSDELVFIDKGRTVHCGKTRDVLTQVFEKEGRATPSSVLEGFKVTAQSKANDSNQSQNAVISCKHASETQRDQNVLPLQGNEQCQSVSGIERVEVAGQEIYVTAESVSYLPQQSGDQVPVRFAVKACDVSIDTNIADFGKASTISILNALPCVISSIEPVANPLSPLNEPENNADTKLTPKKLATANSAKVLLKLVVLDSNQTLCASISSISLLRLKLDVGMQVIARFKLP
ncbi:ATP-binding cassette domain-containing protein [Alteromonas sp. S015]|uniref:ATP-binding cassette domain-containing protein n=1 Tax=Alteromonas sp. S015 TaxID=3117401 RepID=UPI002FE25099